MSGLNLKNSMISLAVLVTLSSCGKSKDLKTDPNAAPAPAAQTAQQPAAPQSGTTLTAPATPTSSNDLTGNSGPANQIPSDNLLPSPGQRADRGDLLPPLPAAPAADPRATDSSVINPPLTPAELGPESSAVDIDFTNQDAVKTGGQTKDLFYTSAGSEGLMEEFKAYSKKVGADQQSKNAALAKAIVTAKLSRSNDTGEISISLAIDEARTPPSQIKNYKLIATPDGDHMKLSAVKGMQGGQLEFAGGILKCVDADGGCETAYAKIKLSGAYTRIIFRNSYADRHFDIQGNVENSAFTTLKMYILNAVNGVNTDQKVDTLEVSSFEVVNGRAGMGALLLMRDREVIGLSIPLVVSANKSIVNAPVALMGDLYKNYNLSLAGNYSQNLSQKISDVKLVANNGQGQLRLKMTLGQANEAGSIWMNVSPVKKDVMSLEEVRAFESKLKNF